MFAFCDLGSKLVNVRNETNLVQLRTTYHVVGGTVQVGLFSGFDTRDGRSGNLVRTETGRELAVTKLIVITG